MPYCKNCGNTWQLTKSDVEGVKSIDELPQLQQICPRCGGKEVVLGKRDRRTARASGVPASTANVGGV